MLSDLIRRKCDVTESGHNHLPLKPLTRIMEIAAWIFSDTHVVANTTFNLLTFLCTGVI